MEEYLLLKADGDINFFVLFLVERIPSCGLFKLLENKSSDCRVSILISPADWNKTEVPLLLIVIWDVN